MHPLDREALQPLARKYVWWKAPIDAVAVREGVIANVMDIGGSADLRALESLVGRPGLYDVLTRAEAGRFHAKSWAFWHYRLELSALGQVRLLPTQSFD